MLLGDEITWQILRFIGVSYDATQKEEELSSPQTIIISQ
jgi:hypothetical protein